VSKSQSKDYIEDAIRVFEQLVHENHPGPMDNINKVSKGEMFVLGFLEREGRALIPSEISEAMNSSTARVSAILNSLEKKEQIEREVDLSNRRNVLVTITPLGIKRVEDMKFKLHHFLGVLFAQMGEEDTLEFIRLVQKFGELAHAILK
jgi:MarR family transcriptional regulator, 2-MHQ and catechol-resistance regulon repressor